MSPRAAEGSLSGRGAVFIEKTRKKVRKSLLGTTGGDPPSVSAMVRMKSGDRVWVEWEGRDGAYLHSDTGRKIHFTGVKLSD